MKHLDQETLIEHHYLPSEGSAAAAHLNVCPACERRYRQLSDRLSGAARIGTDPDDLPDTFWARQSHSIARRLETTRVETPRRWSVSVAGVAAAAILLIVTLAVRNRSEAPAAPQVTATVATTSTVQAEQPSAEQVVQEIQASHDPWESDQLRNLHGVVEWESWMPDANQAEGGTL